MTSDGRRDLGDWKLGPIITWSRGFGRGDEGTSGSRREISIVVLGPRLFEDSEGVSRLIGMDTDRFQGRFASNAVCYREFRLDESRSLVDAKPMSQRQQSIAKFAKSILNLT